MSEGHNVGGVDLDAEREVDLRSLFARIRLRWWLPLAGLILGAVIGVLVSAGGGQTYSAEALLYLGQPFTPSGGGQIQNLGTNPKTVSEVIRSQEALEKASADSGLTIAQLRGNVSSTPVVTPGQLAPSRNFTPLVELAVKGPAKVKVEKAATSFANSVLAVISQYVETKIGLLTKQISEDERQLEQIDQRIAVAQKQQKLAFGSSTFSLAEKLLVSSNANATIANAESRRGAVLTDRNSATQLLSLAQNVERSRLVQEPRGSKASTGGGRTAAIAGGLLGLILGATAASMMAGSALRRANRTS
jgi:uncharacterized protein involved in exopolysaccharide biosynthesis